MESKNGHLHQNILVPNKHTISGNLSRIIHSVIDVTVDMDRMQDARGQRCKACNKFNHFEVCCRTKNTRTAREVLHVQDLSSESHDATFHLGSINCDQTEDPWIVTLKVCDYPVNFKIDNEADINIMSDVTFNRISHQPELAPVNSLLLSPGGKLNCRGKFVTTVKFNGTDYTFGIYVVEGPQSSDLLARNLAHKLNLISSVDEISVFGSCAKHYKTKSIW